MTLCLDLVDVSKPVAVLENAQSRPNAKRRHEALSSLSMYSESSARGCDATADEERPQVQQRRDH